jgi:hypothetical protein
MDVELGRAVDTRELPPPDGRARQLDEGEWPEALAEGEPAGARLGHRPDGASGGTECPGDTRHSAVPSASSTEPPPAEDSSSGCFPPWRLNICATPVPCEAAGREAPSAQAKPVGFDYSAGEIDKIEHARLQRDLSCMEDIFRVINGTATPPGLDPNYNEPPVVQIDNLQLGLKALGADDTRDLIGFSEKELTDDLVLEGMAMFADVVSRNSFLAMMY